MQIHSGPETGRSTGSLAEEEQAERRDASPLEREGGSAQKSVAKELEMVKGEKRDACLEIR